MGNSNINQIYIKMRSYFFVAVTITVVIISISSLAVEGRIGESGVNLLRRMLQDEEATIDQAEKDDTCKDKTPLPIPIGINENLNCKKIKKEELCEEEYDGKYLYESCEKSCEICEEEFETTEAPTGDLLDIEFNMLGDPFDPSSSTLDEEGNHVFEISEAPTLSPIAPFTDAPTESPSAYPTTPPTVNEFGDGGIFEGLDDDELLATLEGI